MINYQKAPNNLGDHLKLYIEHHIPMGGFMNAVLENDLLEAYFRADDINRRLIFEIVSWLYSQAPVECWGSAKKVSEWLLRRK